MQRRGALLTPRLLEQRVRHLACAAPEGAGLMFGAYKCRLYIVQVPQVEGSKDGNQQRSWHCTLDAATCQQSW